ncbi:sulfite oxidase [Candidatus Pelagibacter sp.]|nr:sulfite oxidase [Candidatus Pelagibacter sp.]
MRKSEKKLNINRRNFLAGTATLAGLAATASVVPLTIANANHTAGEKGLPEFISWKNRDALIVHSDKGIETHRSAIGESLITPNRNVYIRNNMPTMTDAQIGDRNNWKVSIHGVKNPKTFSLAQLKKLGHTTIATILQCSGNGRGFFEHKVRGSQWETGAAACVFWTGVPVQAVVEACGGIDREAVFMTSAGVDHEPTGLDPKKAMIERSVPKKVYKDAILAWEMNGVPLPNAHGGPLRMITPGYFGINNVKHLGKVAFTKKESTVKYMKSSYRISPIGKKGSQYPSAWEMPVKSWVTRPTDETGTVKAGKVQIVGIAMGGTKKVRTVKVSVDGGVSWKIARFVGPDLGKYAWRQFVLETTLASGTYTLASLASNGTDEQPELRMENRRGYAHNGWKDHSVQITVV